MTEPFAYCVLCREDLNDRGPIADTVPIGTEDGPRQAHRECMLREVLGGIGHLTDHAFWCTKMHDPDGGMSRRESAIGVDHWVREHGIEAAAAAGTDGLPIPAEWVDDSA